MNIHDRMRELRAPNCIALTVGDFYGIDLFSAGPLAEHGPVYQATLAAHKHDIALLFDMAMIADALQPTAPQVE